MSGSLDPRGKIPCITKCQAGNLEPVWQSPLSNSHP